MTAWRQLSLRWRLMAIGVAGLVVGLAAGGVLLTVVLSLSLDRSIDAGAERTARDVAALVDAGRLPEPVPVAGIQLVQVVDGQGRVRSASPGVDRLVPLLTADQVRRAEQGEHLEIDGTQAGVSGRMRVTALAAGSETEPLTVLVAVPVDEVRRGPVLLRNALLVALPLFVAALAVLAWRVIGLTLRPVEQLRAGAETIAAGGVSDAERLPVPAGGDEIHRLAVTLNGMLDRLERGRRRQRQFVGDAAHELRSPLAGMRTQLEVAQRHPGTTDWDELTSDLLIDTERLSRLTDDLLLLAEADDGAARRPVRADIVDCAELARLVVAGYADARVPVRTSPSPVDGVTVRADVDDVHRILRNLVDNAVRHARGVVVVGVERDEGNALITVTDDGAGIPPADRERVFDRFTRLDDARASSAGGAGLGLPIVAELVRRYGGSIDLADAGPGVRAVVRLPAAAPTE